MSCNREVALETRIPHKAPVDLDLLFKALADPTRRRLLAELDALDGQTLFDLHVRLVSWDALAISRQALSKHLVVLEEAGLIRIEWQWRSKHHFIERKPLRRMLLTWLGPLAGRDVEDEHAEDRRDEHLGG